MGSEQLDWLPVGWRVSVSVRSTGKKDKYYVNPSNGLKFSSKPEVLRFLESSGKDRTPKKLNKIDVKMTVAEKLPPGWIKEIRTKRKGRKIRRDPYYVDPVSGRHFRSMPEVFRYLESKPGDKAHVIDESGDHSQSSSAEAKGRRLTNKEADTNLTGHRSVKSGLNLASGLKGGAIKNVKMLENNHLEQIEEDGSLATDLSNKLQRVNRVKKRTKKMIEIKKLADIKVDKCVGSIPKSKSGSKIAALKKVDIPILKQKDTVNLPNKLPQVNGNEHNSGRRRSVRLSDSKQKYKATKDQSLQSVTEGVTENNISMPESNDLEQREKENNSTQQQNPAHQKKRKDPNSKGSCDTPRRTSKRLARVEVDPSLEIKTSNRAEASAIQSVEPEIERAEIIGNSGPSDEPQVDISGNPSNDSNEHHSERKMKNQSKNKEKHIHHSNPTSLKEHKGVGVDCKEEDKNLDSSLKDLLMDPCIEFAVKTLTGVIPIEEVNKADNSPVSSLSSPNQTLAASSTSSKLPPSDIWAYPCFEFAVKMLTGEMPVEDGARCKNSVGTGRP